jgi:hypothetical protein
MPKRKLLPKPGDKIHLSKDGYTTHKVATSRRKSLRKTSKKHGSLTVLKRLNLIRNLTKKGSSAHEVMSSDVDYMKKVYEREKRRQSRSKEGSKKEGSKRKGSKK